MGDSTMFAGRSNKSDMRSSLPTVLKVDHVAKSFRLPTEQATGVKMAFLNWTRGIKGYAEQKVLRDISFEVKQGDFFGIVGRNGSGKSTLLKIISQIYMPDRGEVTVVGKLVPFIELGVGFNPELTGRENVYLNGALLGFSRTEIDEMYDDIVQFAELDEFMDQKLKNYSSGMQVRLAFSVAIKAQGDILVLDEVLAVGDEAFQRKCDSFFSEIKQDPTKTVVLVTHSMESVKKYCTNAILIKDGEIIASGDKNDVADQYTLENLEVRKSSSEQEISAENGTVPRYDVGLNARCPVLKIVPVSPLMRTSSEYFEFGVEYEFGDPEDFFITLTLLDCKRGGIVMDTGKDLTVSEHGHHVMHFRLPLNAFNDGEYKLQAQLRTIEGPEAAPIIEKVAYTNDGNSCLFIVRDSSNINNYGLLSDRMVAFERLRAVRQ